MYLYSSVKKITLSLRPCFRLDLFRVFTWNHLSVVGIRVPLRHFPSPGNQNYLAAEPSWWLASARHRNLGTKAPNLELHRTLPVVLTTYDTIWFPLFYVISSILWVSSTLLLFVNKTLNSSFCKPSSLSSVYHTSIQLRIYGPFNIQPRKKQELTYIASTLCCCPMQSSPARSWRNRGKFLVNYRETGCLLMSIQSWWRKWTACNKGHLHLSQLECLGGCQSFHILIVLTRPLWGWNH